MQSISDFHSLHPRIQRLNSDTFAEKEISLSILRLDEIDEYASGNKVFKLHYFLKEAMASQHKRIVTFGGPYSNHLAATAYACKQEGLESAGVVRGEKPAVLSPTLSFCIAQGMKLKFISRNEYRNIAGCEFKNNFQGEFGEHIFVPEGGFSIKGRRGAEIITDFFDEKNYTHICCAIGTATTFAGLLNSSNGITEIQGFPVLKNLRDINARLERLMVSDKHNFTINDNYHFGGYAKKTSELLIFMNNFYESNNIPLDFVYTGKMMFGVYELINYNYYSPGSNILCIHTGGLQGNKSLAPGTLNF